MLLWKCCLSDAEIVGVPDYLSLGNMVIFVANWYDDKQYRPMKKLIGFLVALFCMTAAAAQEGNWRISVLGGYENFPGNPYTENGYRLGGEVRYYPSNRIYILADFHAGFNQGHGMGTYPPSMEKPGEGRLDWKIRELSGDYGVGWEFVQTRRSALFLQGTLGVNVRKTYLPQTYWEEGYVPGTREKDKTVRTALGFALGYDYHLSPHWVIGVDYSGYFHWKILDRIASLWLISEPSCLQHSVNVRLGWEF